MNAKLPHELPQVANGDAPGRLNIEEDERLPSRVTRGRQEEVADR